MRINKVLLTAALGSGLLSVLFAAMLFLQAPTPLDAQTGVARFSTMSVGSFYRAVPRTAITLANNDVLTATGTFQRVTAASAIGTSGGNIVIKPAGTMVTLLNVGANTITFTETGILKSAGNIALGTLDSATLWSDGTNWYEVGASNN